MLSSVGASCFVSDVLEDASSGPGASATGPGSAGPGPGATGSGANISNTSAGGTGSSGGGSSGGAGGGVGQGGNPDTGGAGGATGFCGDGTTDENEDCDVAAPWCVGCAWACNAGDEAWNSANKHCYRFIKRPELSFDEANQDCGLWRPNATLASITSLEERTFVQGQVTSKIAPFVNTYLGGRKVTGAWTWVSGEPWGYTNFHAGEGNNGSETCLGLYTSTGPGPWHDFTCSPGEAYVCEWTPAP